MIKRPEYGSVEYYERELKAQYIKYDITAKGIAHRLIGLAETLKEYHQRETAIQELNTLGYILESAATGIEKAKDDLREVKEKESANEEST